MVDADADGDDDATPRERELIARLPAPLRSMRARDVARVAVEAFGIGARAPRSSRRAWRAYERALARANARSTTSEVDAARAPRRPRDDSMDLESVVDGLTTCARCGRAVPAESLEEHAATRCDGGASRRGRDALVRADVLVREGVEAGSGRGRGRGTKSSPPESRGGGGRGRGGGRGGGRGSGRGRGTWAAAKPLAVRMDVRETRRAHDAMVFRIMFDARARDEDEEEDASPETSARAKKVAKVGV